VIRELPDGYIEMLDLITDDLIGEDYILYNGDISNVESGDTYEYWVYNATIEIPQKSFNPWFTPPPKEEKRYCDYTNGKPYSFTLDSVKKSLLSAAQVIENKNVIIIRRYK
jgi:hypothetical protein